ncbi:MAG: transcription termination factor NusA [Bacillota bacterium]|nr:transcription termination factor NusA [Bacillota bacterium]
MNVELIEAINAIEKERRIDKETLFDALEEALKKAYKNHFGSSENARVAIDRETGDFKVFALKTVIDGKVEDPNMQISIADAQKVDPKYDEGDIFEQETTPHSFGRIAAQTAKQVVMQRIREAERSVIYDEFSDKLNESVTAVIQRMEGGNVYLELGRAEGFMPATEQVENEKYMVGDRLKVLILRVEKDSKSRTPGIVVSRRHRDLIKRLLELEVPEIQDGTLLIKSIAREAGVRSKVAVYSTDENVDAIGACVGQKGSRIGRVAQELNGEKIDVIPWSSDPIEFIANSLSPAKVLIVQINESEKIARVTVPDKQLSLAIGIKGINAKLAAKLTGWKIDIKSQTQAQEFFSETDTGTEEEEDDDDNDDEDVKKAPDSEQKPE